MKLILALALIASLLAAFTQELPFWWGCAGLITGSLIVTILKAAKESKGS